MTPVEFNNFISDGSLFLENLLAELSSKIVDLDSLQCDHLCFRVDCLENYKLFYQGLSNYGELLTESLVNGRPICTFRLNSNFKIRNFETSIVELPAPKIGSPYKTGFEHAEFVISEDLKSFAHKHSHLNFSIINKKVNSELQLPLNCGMVKFHRLSLERIIEIEKSKITDIIFDFDGTLIDSRDAIYEINRQVFSQILNQSISIEESIKNFHPEFPKLFEAFNVVQTSKKTQAIELWSTISSEIDYQLFDGIMEMLHKLRKNGLRLHLWTARDEISAVKILSFHGIMDFFETMSFSSNIKSKPHQDSLLFNWNASLKDSILVIGDSVTDVHGAHNIRAISGAALWCPHATNELLENSGAEIFFSKPSEVTNWILQQSFA